MDWRGKLTCLDILQFSEAQQNILMVAGHYHLLYVERQSHRVPRRFSVLNTGLLR